jgi:hypothetical protein
MTNHRRYLPGMPQAANGVPIIGRALKNYICTRGHLDRLPGPFAMVLPNEQGQAQPVFLCRLCYLSFLQTEFAVREATPAEMEVIEANIAKRAAEEEAKREA